MVSMIKDPTNTIPPLYDSFTYIKSVMPEPTSTAINLQILMFRNKELFHINNQSLYIKLPIDQSVHYDLTEFKYGYFTLKDIMTTYLSVRIYSKSDNYRMRGAIYKTFAIRFNDTKTNHHNVYDVTSSWNQGIQTAYVIGSI